MSPRQATLKTSGFFSITSLHTWFTIKIHIRSTDCPFHTFFVFGNSWALAIWPLGVSSTLKYNFIFIFKQLHTTSLFCLTVQYEYVVPVQCWKKAAGSQQYGALGQDGTFVIDPLQIVFGNSSHTYSSCWTIQELVAISAKKATVIFIFHLNVGTIYLQCLKMYSTTRQCKVHVTAALY